MKDFITEFLKMLANAITIICFAFMAFLLIINVYHYREINYSVQSDLNHNVSYNNYKKSLSDVDQKMNSVKFSSVSAAKPIYQYYSKCMDSINKGAFNSFGNKTSISSKDLYDANDEMISVYNNKCLFYISNNIDIVTKNAKSFEPVKKLIDEKAQIIVDNADYLRKSQLANSSYGYSTDSTRYTIYNRINNEVKLTINNYNILASVLEDIANWYVAEYGGNS